MQILARAARSLLPASAFAVALCSLLSSPTRAQLPAGADEAWADIVSEWRESVRGGGVVGASLGLVRGGDLVALETEGLADLEESRPVDRSTIYHWASITKTFTAIAILQLRDRGLISLDDPIVDYVPELREVRNTFGAMEDITIRHLLSHSAGFRGSTWPWAGSEDWQPHEPTEWSQLVSMLPYTQVLFEPGSRFSYSNPGIIYLGRVIEKVTGDVFEAYIEKNIFRPLGMRSAYFDVTPWHLHRHRSNHYSVRNGVPEPGGLDFNTGITVSNGGLNASLPDLARYLSFLLGSPAEGADHDAVLSRQSLREMWEPHVPIPGSPLGEAAMGLSYFLYDRDGVRVVGHTGTQRTFYSFFYVDPSSDVGVVAAFNTGGVDGSDPDTNAIRVRTTQRILSELFPLFRQQAR